MSKAGAYAITFRGHAEIANANDILDLPNFQPGTFTITQATLVITANPATEFTADRIRRSPFRSAGSSRVRPLRPVM